MVSNERTGWTFGRGHSRPLSLVSILCSMVSMSVPFRPIGQHFRCFDHTTGVSIVSSCPIATDVVFGTRSTDVLIGLHEHGCSIGCSRYDWNEMNRDKCILCLVTLSYK